MSGSSDRRHRRPLNMLTPECHCPTTTVPGRFIAVGLRLPTRIVNSLDTRHLAICRRLSKGYFCPPHTPSRVKCRRATAWKQYMSWLQPYWYNNALQAAYSMRFGNVLAQRDESSNAFVPEVSLCVPLKVWTVSLASLDDFGKYGSRDLLRISTNLQGEFSLNPIFRPLFTYSPHQRHELSYFTGFPTRSKTAVIAWRFKPSEKYVEGEIVRHSSIQALA
ncbi:hypothetical protein ARMSODRAFT_975035 [Armillaria solidipes]|uniref:Uncharacterized protein n=1 Tax=Armillaria solidipes TaxID=1076256 RepID=A0A2H3BGJ6_9AGAR|nr:hypothetical protein ARMSODRAFT_975035 [Armillaria solidipes]